MTLKTDSRPIQSVTMPGEGGWWWAVGKENVTRIELYFENGQTVEVPWLAVHEGDTITFRVNVAHVEYISYDKPK